MRTENKAALVPQMASLPRATAKALEQVVETLLAALHADSAALWINHEGSLHTLVVRNLPFQNISALQQVVTVSPQSAPTTVQSQGQRYVVACVGYPLLKVYIAVAAEQVRPVHRQLLPRFARLAQTLLQSNHAPIQMPWEDRSRHAYRVVVEDSLRRLGDLMQATGCVLLWFSSWNNLWHRFAVGNVPAWLYQQLWEMPSPGDGLDAWIERMQTRIQQRGYHCVAEGLRIRDMQQGGLLLWRPQLRGRFTTEEVEWLRMTVHMIAASLDVLETQTELLQRVYHDPLTGVFNRLYFDLAYRQILHNAQRHPRPVSLLLIDIDHFKRINDTYGHETGDIVLQIVGQALQQVRTGDIPARYGGDEFVVLLPDTDKGGARALAQRLQRTVCHMAENLGLPFRVTLSIGCATVANGDSNLLLLADQDMYEQKRVEKEDCKAAS
ncbi:MAG: GGDEF domain-containing protein [Armatimonadetes bacterium]|nr:GGDEF domain-containing protein [Armatimonadota bacterium]